VSANEIIRSTLYDPIDVTRVAMDLFRTAVGEELN
jgi:hypothetical protein